MSLTTSPFHPTTGELLPVYQDAYLRGDLSGTSSDLVDAYLKANPTKGHEAYQRFYALQDKGHAVRPAGWLQQQLHLIRTEPARFRQRAGSMVVAAVLLSGAVFAANTLPKNKITVSPAVSSSVALSMSEASSAVTATTVVKGRILDENGRPLIGATVLHKASGRGVSTDAAGNYSLAVPANQTSQLQFGYGGYTEEEIQVKGASVQNVTLLPNIERQKGKRHWWQF
ncbi:MAG: carboxypeptidase-like regulatory domain-containing protein [Janthinobacterium lividum]